MVAHILSPGKSFRGVGYNENKVIEGKAEFLSSHNFKLFGNPTKDSVINYFEKMCSLNKTVKNKQFHAIISCEGTQFSSEQLEKIGVEWMGKMGYGEQPFLIYFHSDTDNNHVHLVSCRIDKNGQRIEPYLEGERAVKNINEIMKNDLVYSAKQDCKKILNYNFTSITQAKLLLEQMGWKVSEKEGNVNLIKNGRVQHSIGSDILNEKIKLFTLDLERKKQLIALLYKYSKGMNLDEMKHVLKLKFGIDLIFHFGKGHTTPYGYTLIDHAKMTIYKGGEIVPLKELMNQQSKQEKIKAIEDIIAIYTTENSSFSDFKRELSILGFNVSNKGEIGIKGEKRFLFQLAHEEFKKLKYNDRLIEASKFKCKTERERRILAKVFYVKTKDITMTSVGKEILRQHYEDFIFSISGNKLNPDSTFLNNDYLLVKDGAHTYIFDKREKSIVDTTNFDLSKITQYTTIENLEDKNYQNNIEQAAGGSNFIKELFNFISVASGSGEPDRKRKRTSEYNN